MARKSSTVTADAPALDWGTVVETVSEAEPQEVEQKTASIANHPAVALLKSSYDTGKWLKMTVPSTGVKEVANKLRQSSNFLNLGVRIKTHERDDGNVDVFFLGRERQTRTRKNSDD